MRFIVDTMGDPDSQADFFCSKTRLIIATGNGLILKAIAIVAGFFLRAIGTIIIKLRQCNAHEGAKV